ncbi:class I SAM-dependent methyltransferase [Caldisericum sp.]|uniref:class I SAM-dependent methyltransferase n=1 Tax=Caldisericum sp. TaxID=2499687 RepID=UPI003D0DBAFB
MKRKIDFKVSGGGERLVIRDWYSAKNSRDFSTLAHIQRYEWVLPYLKGLRCLDDGCGSGYGTYYLAKNGVSMIIGIDISSVAIKFAKKHYKAENLEFRQMDALHLQFDPNSFDAVISFDVLEHINEHDQKKFISEIVRVLREEGVAYIGCPNAQVSMGNNPFHMKELTKKEFELLLREFFYDVKIYGQDLVVNGLRAGENWHKYLSNLSYENLVIVEENCEIAYGLLAICKKPIK